MNSNGNYDNLKSMARSSRLISFKSNISNSQLETVPQRDQPTNPRMRSTFSRSPIRPQSTTIYDSLGPRRDRQPQTQSTMVQDVIQMKIMLLKLKRILDMGDDEMKNSEEPIKNGLTNGLNGTNEDHTKALNNQILHLENQLEDKDQTIKQLQQQISSLILINEQCVDNCRVGGTINVANVSTQTEKCRPQSMGPLMLQDVSPDRSLNYFPSETSKHDPEESTLRLNYHLRKSLPRLWRKSREPTSLQGTNNNVKNTTSQIPRRAKSHSRSTSTPV